MNLAKYKLSDNVVEIKIFNHFVHALIDTGSCKSVVSEQLIKELGVKINKGSKLSNFLTTADGSPMKVLGTAMLNVRISNLSVPYEFLVVSRIQQDMIMGLDFLKYTRAQINCSDNTVTFYDDMIATDLLRHQRCIARLSNPTILPPRSETIVKLKVNNTRFNSCYLLEPLPMQQKQKFLTARAIVKSRGKFTFARILNLTNDEIFMHRNHKIASLEQIHESNIAMYDLEDLPDKPTVKGQSINAISVSNNKVHTESHANDKPRKLQEMGITLESSHLSSQQKEKLTAVIEENFDAFAYNLQQLPGTNLQAHVIETGDSPPVRQRPYRYSPAARKEIEQQTAEMLESGLIKPSSSMWSSPCVLVKKKNDTYRMCIDYRKLNTCTKQISFPIPLLTDVWDALAENNPGIFSLLDLKSGFHQIPMHPDSMDKTAFVTHQSQYSYTRLPFGLKNASNSYQMVMNEVFRGMTWKYLMVYIDDILIYSRNFEEHLTHLQNVFDRLKQANLKLHPQKCNFALEKIVYLGHILSKEGIAVDEKKIKAVTEWPIPKTVKDVRAFLGFCGYYRRFVKDFAKIAAPLNNLLKKDTVFLWNAECQAAFQTLRDAMTTTPILSYPQMDQPFILTTDASTHAIGYVLSQIGSDGKEHPLAFGGRALRPPEKNWPVSDIEGLALIEAIREYKMFLSQREFTVYTDHISLTWLRSLRNTSGRLYRWSLYCQPYNFVIKFKAGKGNINADALSRRVYAEPEEDTEDDDLLTGTVQVAQINQHQQNDSNSTCSVSDDDFETSSESSFLDHEETQDEEADEPADVICEPVITYFRYENPPVSKAQQTEYPKLMNISDLAQKQRQCEDLSRIVEYLETGETPLDARLARQTEHEATQYFMKDGILYHQTPAQKTNNMPEIEQIAIPQSLRKTVIEQHHDQNCHCGIDRTYETIRRKYYWPGLYRDIKQYCKTCLVCQRVKRDFHFRRASLNPLPVTDTVGSRYHIDICGPLKETKEGYKYILLCVESYSRYPEAHPLKTQEAQEVADVLYNQIICRYGAMETLVSDRGANFMSKLVARLCQLFDINHTKTSAYRPQTNAACESFNRNIWAGLKCYCDKQDEWDKYLQTIMLAYRSTVSTYSTKFTPFEVLFGRQMRLPLDNCLRLAQTELNPDKDKYMATYLEKVKIVQELAKENILVSQQYNKQQFDKKAKLPEFQVGEKVWLYDPVTPLGHSRKLQIHWKGPYYIVDQTSDCNFVLRNCETHKQIGYPIHSDRLKLYHEPEDIYVRSCARNISQSAKDQTNNGDQPDNGDARNLDKMTDDPATNVTTSDNEDDDDVNEEVKDQDTWYPARKLLKIRKINNAYHYLVDWTEPGSKPTWENEKDISENLKINFHVTRTKEGKLRKKLKTKDKDKL